MRTPRLSRRQLIRTGLAGSVTAALAAWAEPGRVAAQLWPSDRAGQPRPPSIPLHAMVLDERFAEAARFGASVRAQGLATRAIQGDVTDLWYHELHLLWKQSAVPVAGLTAYAALFCLEQLAWDHRMRVIFRGTHTRRADGQVEHVLAGPQQVVAAIRPAAAGDWPAELASTIARVESEGGWTGLAPASGATELRFVTHDTPSAQHPARSLYSWVIALPSRA